MKKWFLVFGVMWMGWGPGGCMPEGYGSIGTATNTIGVVHLKSKEEMGITCKTVTDQACPYCSHERCHDDKHQWDESTYSCPAIICTEKHTDAFKPEEWK